MSVPAPGAWRSLVIAAATMGVQNGVVMAFTVLIRRPWGSPPSPCWRGSSP